MVEEMKKQTAPKSGSGKKALVVGGAGFIGCNTAAEMMRLGYKVLVFDNLSRKGTDENLKWLQQQQGDIEFIQGDLRYFDKVHRVFKIHPDIDIVLHLAAQVAVTTSVADPREDFETNALGTFNLLESIRLSPTEPILLYSSTNKVYGDLPTVPIEEKKTRYVFRDIPRGVDESCCLDFHTPYGCSKGSADQYVRDYARIFGLKTIVFRQSCIYGVRQFGVEDQGWVAWFIIATQMGRPITIYGNGKQVRDALNVKDLARAYLAAVDNIDKTAGEVYNVGGGPENTLSIWAEFGPMLEDILGRKIPVTYADWRPGDQEVFICNIDKAKRDFGWSPEISVRQGVEQLCGWVRDNEALIKKILS